MVDHIRAAIERRVFGNPQIKFSAADLVRVVERFGGSSRDVAQLSARSAPPGSGTRITKFATSHAPDSSVYNFTASTASVDLMGDVIRQGGAWDLRNFSKNGPILYAHDSTSLPVGRAVSASAEPDGLRISLTLASPADSPFVGRVEQLLDERVLRGCSVGFVPGTWRFSEDKSRPFGAIDFIDGHRLLELSLTPTPANPDCLLRSITPPSGKSVGWRRDVPKDDYPLPENTGDWCCRGTDTMPVDSSDDPFDSKAAKAALLAKFSPAGTIIPDDAAGCFLAYDASAPLLAASYRFPFAKLVDNAVVASKIGWRQSLAAIEASDLPGRAISDARALVDKLEARLDGSTKVAALRAEIRAAQRRVEKLPDPVPPTPAERRAEAKRLRIEADRLILASAPPGALTAEQRAAQSRLTRAYIEEQRR